MNQLDPVELFQAISSDIPKHLQRNLFVTGSLAAAYHYRTKLQGQAINTKDADLVVHPAGNSTSCKEITEELLRSGWRPTDQCTPMAKPEPADELWAIRLYPPNSKTYFIEFLNIPEKDQIEAKSWIPVQLADGWYGLPSFRFLGLTAINRVRSDVGLEYASPSRMALANLLSHPKIGSQCIKSGPMKDVLRSAKDLGRVIALAHLAGREETETWQEPWIEAVKNCFPSSWPGLLRNLGTGLEELIQDDNVLSDAYKTTDIGLLNGMSMTPDQLRATGERLMGDVVEPIRQSVRG